MSAFDPDYASCAYTHVWLRVMHESLDLDEVTNLLGVEPTSTQAAGDLATLKPGRKRRQPGWFLDSREHVSSLDSRHHVQWLLERISGRGPALAELLSRGYLVDICCRWDSSWGNGGPTMDPSQMTQLGQLGVDFWFDVYLAQDQEPEA
ncbi:DUF4279 domain-containing protein [Cognatiluteimonas weifangensis]|uniref:DUF4279 domain-containing protein n=1 Tax=Cognatiluteimonas weifangensis TaxID=2303539 RepID=A0A372DGP7_9GAMM|nr:DUF4279 domain-containing protein [Luteimonas weifangensis]RFP58038.1 DUF4279 domain-containing protein [Luteimonas weifangensis]